MSVVLLKYVQLEYVPSPTQAEGIPWTVVAADPASPNDGLLIYEIEGCGPLIEVDDREYLDEMLSDWKLIPNKNGVSLLNSLSGLAIGPIRTALSGECTEEELCDLARTLSARLKENCPLRSPDNSESAPTASSTTVSSY